MAVAPPYGESGMVSNFRDIGGYATQDGRHIRHRAVYRSGTPYVGMGSLGLPKSLSLRLVVDLRRLRKKAPAVWDGHPAKYLNIALGYEPASLRKRLAMLCQGGMQRLYDQEMAHNYKKMAAESPGQLRPFFRRLGHADSYPLLVHCQHGKDRTGFAIAVLMKLLGVPDREIASEFMRSRPLPSVYHSIFGHQRHKHAYLQAAMDEIIKTYQSWPAYFEAGLLLKAHEQEKIKSLLLA